MRNINCDSKTKPFSYFITGNVRLCGVEVVLLPVFPQGFYHYTENADLKFPQHWGNGNARRGGVEVVLLPVFPRGFYHSTEKADLKLPQHNGNDH